jgi:hypothetical protein
VTGLVARAALILALGHGELRYAVMYDPDLMAAMAEKRGVAAAECYFAHPTLPIGTRARIRGLVTGHEELCIEADTSAGVDTTGRGSQESDRQRHIRLRRVELGFDEAARICPPGWRGKASECAVWFRVIPE